jgi:hypothetical protein
VRILGLMAGLSSASKALSSHTLPQSHMYGIIVDTEC